MLSSRAVRFETLDHAADRTIALGCSPAVLPPSVRRTFARERRMSADHIRAIVEGGERKIVAFPSQS